MCQKTILHPRTTISKEMIPHPEQKLNRLILRVILQNRITIDYLNLTESWNPALDADDYYYYQLLILVVVTKYSSQNTGYKSDFHFVKQNILSKHLATFSTCKHVQFLDDEGGKGDPDPPKKNCIINKQPQFNVKPFFLI